MKASIALLLPLLALAGCGSGEADETPPVPTPTPTFDAGPRTLVAVDLDLAGLGPHIQGLRQTEVESPVPGLGTMVSYVACPAEITGACDPDTLPDGTLYTYVHEITVEVSDNERAEEQFSGATLFRTTLPTPGFANVIGYSRAQAEQALGESGEIRVQSDNGQLIWRVTAGDGWMPGETLTFFWQSTLPPAGPEEAYLLAAEDLSGAATGPFPADPSPVDETPGP